MNYRDEYREKRPREEGGSNNVPSNPSVRIKLAPPPGGFFCFVFVFVFFFFFFSSPGGSAPTLKIKLGAAPAAPPAAGPPQSLKIKMPSASPSLKIKLPPAPPAAALKVKLPPAPPTPAPVASPTPSLKVKVPVTPAAPLEVKKEVEKAEKKEAGAKPLKLSIRVSKEYVNRVPAHEQLMTGLLAQFEDFDKVERIFYEIPSDAVAYNYSKVITHPMSWSEMRRKLAGHRYFSIGQF
jgi:hypothetical protein